MTLQPSENVKFPRDRLIEYSKEFQGVETHLVFFSGVRDRHGQIKEAAFPRDFHGLYKKWTQVDSRVNRRWAALGSWLIILY